MRFMFHFIIYCLVANCNEVLIKLQQSIIKLNFWTRFDLLNGGGSNTVTFDALEIILIKISYMSEYIM